MIQMHKDKIGILKLSKTQKKSDSVIVMPEEVDSLGLVKYIGESAGLETGLKVGDKVYYGTKRERIRMVGEDIEVMEPDNIVAHVRGELNEQEETNS